MVTCSHCGHDWEYSGDHQRATCPSCGRKTRTDLDGVVPVHMVAYEDDAELNVESDEFGRSVITNHDELVNNGMTYREIRMLSRANALKHNLDIVERSDSIWFDVFEDAEKGDAWRLDELREMESEEGDVSDDE